MNKDEMIPDEVREALDYVLSTYYNITFVSYAQPHLDTVRAWLDAQPQAPEPDWSPPEGELLDDFVAIVDDWLAMKQEGSLPRYLSMQKRWERVDSTLRAWRDADFDKNGEPEATA